MMQSRSLTKCVVDVISKYTSDARSAHFVKQRVIGRSRFQVREDDPPPKVPSEMFQRMYHKVCTFSDFQTRLTFFQSFSLT